MKFNDFYKILKEHKNINRREIYSMQIPNILKICLKMKKGIFCFEHKNCYKDFAFYFNLYIDTCFMKKFSGSTFDDFKISFIATTGFTFRSFIDSYLLLKKNECDLILKDHIYHNVKNYTKYLKEEYKCELNIKFVYNPYFNITTLPNIDIDFRVLDPKFRHSIILLYFSFDDHIYGFMHLILCGLGSDLTKFKFMNKNGELSLYEISKDYDMGNYNVFTVGYTYIEKSKYRVRIMRYIISIIEYILSHNKLLFFLETPGIVNVSSKIAPELMGVSSSESHATETLAKRLKMTLQDGIYSKTYGKVFL